jgi:hypothetical protein
MHRLGIEMVIMVMANQDKVDGRQIGEWEWWEDVALESRERNGRTVGIPHGICQKCVTVDFDPKRGVPYPTDKGPILLECERPRWIDKIDRDRVLLSPVIVIPKLPEAKIPKTPPSTREVGISIASHISGQ